MFADRLKTLLHIICANSSDLARYMNCDRSNISRFIRGVRTPERDGGAAQRLAGALYSAAEISGRTEELRGVIGCGCEGDDDSRSALLDWLYQDEKEPEKADKQQSKAACISFGERLNNVMNLAEISNIQLGRLLSLDPSYISRFRSGLRSPKSNVGIMDGMAAVLLDRVYERERVKELSKLMERSLPDEKGKAYPVFYTWLYGVEKDDAPAIEALMERIGAFPSRMKPETSAAGGAQADLDERSVYFGNDGLREAVIRFLSFVADNGCSEIYLYSDRSMAWMMENSAFAAEWAALMSRCVVGGTRVNIIHNIERGFEEMAGAINSWLPLYPSGMIRSYYCRRRSDTRFSTTLFVCPGHACVTGHNLKDGESGSGMYRYDTSPEIINANMRTFSGLFKQSSELIKVFRTLQIEKLAVSAGSGTTVLASRLSLATMPRDVLRSLLKRGGATAEQTREITAMWETQRDFYKRCLQRYYIHECIPITGDMTPFADCPGLDVRYTEDEYKEHLNEIRTMMRKRRGYKLYPLKEPVFDDLRVRMARDEIVVSRLSAPHISFVFEHPYMCGSFIAYGRNIKENYTEEMKNAPALLKKLTGE